MNVFCAISKNHVHGPFYLRNMWLAMFQNWLMNELTANEHEDFIYIQDGAPSHWKLTVRSYLNDNLPGKCIERAGGEDNGMLKWPPRSPDLISCDFFFSGNMRTTWFMSPLFLQM